MLLQKDQSTRIVLAGAAVAFWSGAQVTAYAGATDRGPAAAKTEVGHLELQPAVGPTSPDNPELDAASSPPQQRTLDAAVQLGVKNATAISKADQSLRLSAAQLLQSYAQFLPNLTLSAVAGEAWGKSYQYTPKPALLNTANYGLTMQLSTNVNLFNGCADQAGVRAALERKDAATMTLARAKQQIAIDITQAYLQVILDQRLLDIARQSLGSSRHREELLREQTKLGVKDIGNLYTQQAQTATDETAVVSAGSRLQSDIMHLLQRLKVIGGVYTWLPPRLTEVAPFGEQTRADELVRQAMEQRQDLKAADAASRAADAAVTVAEAGYYPRLDIGFSLNDLTRRIQHQSLSGVDQGPFVQDPLSKQLQGHFNYTAALTLSWSPFDRGVTRLAVARAEVDAAGSRVDADDLHRQVLTEVKQALEDFRSASSRLATARRGVTAANKSFERIEARYGVGAATFLDVTTAQVVLAQAQSAQAQAQIDVHLQAQVLRHVVGAAE